MNTTLLNALVNDEKKFNENLYSPGKYWKKKSDKILREIKRCGFQNFRGLNNGIGSSYTDSLIYDIRNELNYPLKFISLILKFPYLSNIFERQLHVTSSYIKKYLNYQNQAYNNERRVHDLIKKYSFNDTTQFGCLRKFNFKKKEYSVNYLKVAHRNDTIQKYIDFRNINTYMEIGGGFGSNIHFLITNFKNIKKIIYLDIVPNIFIGTLYLKNFFGDSVKDYNHFKNLDKISFSKDHKLEIFCIPPWCINRLDITIDHFHNSASFVEMPIEIVKNYSKYLYKNKMKSYSLISYLDYNPNTTFDPNILAEIFKDSEEKFVGDSLISGINKKSLFILKKISKL